MAFVWISPRSYEHYYLPLTASGAAFGLPGLGGHRLSTNDPRIVRFLSPLIEAGNLNAVIVIGDPYSHGRFDRKKKID